MVKKNQKKNPKPTRKDIMRAGSGKVDAMSALFEEALNVRAGDNIDLHSKPFGTMGQVSPTAEDKEHSSPVQLKSSDDKRSSDDNKSSEDKRSSDDNKSSEDKRSSEDRKSSEDRMSSEDNKSSDDRMSSDDNKSSDDIFHGKRKKNDKTYKKPRKGYHWVDNTFTDSVLPCLRISAGARVVLERLYRLSYGFQRNHTDYVGKKNLSKMTGMTTRHITRVLTVLENMGLITVRDLFNGGSDVYKRGRSYYVADPRDILITYKQLGRPLTTSDTVDNMSSDDMKSSEDKMSPDDRRSSDVRKSTVDNMSSQTGDNLSGVHKIKLNNKLTKLAPLDTRARDELAFLLLETLDIRPTAKLLADAQQQIDENLGLYSVEELEGCIRQIPRSKMRLVKGLSTFMPDLLELYKASLDKQKSKKLSKQKAVQEIEDRVYRALSKHMMTDGLTRILAECADAVDIEKKAAEDAGDASSIGYAMKCMMHKHNLVVGRHRDLYEAEALRYLELSGEEVDTGRMLSRLLEE